MASRDPDSFFYGDGDIEQAELEAAGQSYAKRWRRMRKLRAAGKLAEAAAACPHGSGFPLRSVAATDTKDPRAGQDGYRCCTCGSVLDGEPFGRIPKVLFPCEEPDRWGPS